MVDSRNDRTIDMPPMELADAALGIARCSKFHVAPTEAWRLRISCQPCHQLVYSAEHNTKTLPKPELVVFPLEQSPL